MSADLSMFVIKSPCLALNPTQSGKNDKNQAHVGECSGAIIVEDYIDGDGIC